MSKFIPSSFRSGYRHSFAVGLSAIVFVLASLPWSAALAAGPVPTLTCGDHYLSRNSNEFGFDIDFNNSVREFATGVIEVTHPPGLVANSIMGFGFGPTYGYEFGVFVGIWNGDFSPATGDDLAVTVRVPAGVIEASGTGETNTASNTLHRSRYRTVSVGDASALEGTDSNIEFEVTLGSRDDCETVTVDWETAPGTATAGDDYTAASGTLTFGPSETTKTVRIALLDDTQVENDESLTLRLSNASGAKIADDEATGTVTDDDGNSLRVSISAGSKSVTRRSITPVSNSVTEGAAAVFTLTRTGSLADALTVNVNVTETGAMLKGSPAATVTFDANSAIAELSVETEDDEVAESASIITAALLTGDHYSTDTNRASATVTVQDDDAAPSITVSGQTSAYENTTAVATLTATDDDTPVADLAWSIVGGADAAAFSLSEKGVLTFAAAKDFEAPDDADQDGDYEVTVRVTDGANPAVDATLTVQLADVDEGAPRLSGAKVDSDTLTLTFDKALDGSSVPASNSFSVRVEAVSRDYVRVSYLEVSDVSVSGSTVTLTLASASAVVAGERVFVSYRTPTGTNANPLQDAADNAVFGFSNQLVTNETPAQVNTPATGKPGISGTASVGTTLSASASGIADTDGLSNATYAWQWIANDGTSDADIAGATGSTYTLTSAEAGKTIKVRVTFTDDGGAEEALVSEATAEVASVNAAPVGLPRIAGTPQIGGTLTASSAGISDADGLTNATYAWQWIANDGTSDADIAGATGATYTLTAAEAGKAIKVRVTFTDDGGTEETLESAATAAVEAGLTASFEDVPASHDGSSAFRLRLAFSEEVFEGSEPFDKNRAIQDALVVNGGAVTGRARVNRNEFDQWWIRVAPSGNGAVTVSLPAQTDCAGAGAVCTPDGTALASRVSATVPGPVSQKREVSIAAANSSTTRNVTADSSPVTEGTAAEFTLTRTGSLADALTVNVSVTETGAMLSRTVPETVTFNANSPTAELRVETEDDEVAEPASVVTAAVAAGSGYAMDSSAASASVTVEDDDAAPVVQTAAIVTVPENMTAVATLTATDDDTPVADLAWSIVGGADAAMFTVSAGGDLAFASAKDFEAPDDADTDGDYEVTVRVTDGANAVDAALTVRLADVDLLPEHTGPISVSVQCVDSAYRIDAHESILWEMHFSAPVREVGENDATAASPFEIAGQDDTDFTWFAIGGTDVPGRVGPRHSSYRWATTPRVPRPDGWHSAVVSDVNGVVITVPAGRWQDMSGNPNFNTASANALYLAHNWKVSVADASATEGTDGTIDFEVTLNARDDCKTVTVDWTTADGTATAGEDYAAASGTLTFGPGETSKTIRVALLETADVDGSETLSVQLGNASGVTLDDAEAIGTISGEEGANVPATGQTLTAGPGDIADGNGIANATFAWQWIANDGTSDADISGATGATYTLTAAEAGKTIKVRATFTDDGGTEETLVSEGTAAVTAALPSVSVAAVSSPVTEGTAASFRLSRSGDTAPALTVAVSVTVEGAVVSTAPASSVTFAAGSAEANLNVATVDDSVAEADARVSVSVTAGPGYLVGNGSGSARVDVYDNDEVASAPVETLWTSTLEWQGDYGAGWVNANEEDFSSPGWSEDGDDYRIWYIAYGSSSGELWVRADPNMRAGGIPASGELTLQVGQVTVESAGTMARFARGDIAVVRGIEPSWAVGEQIQVRLTRTTAGETAVTGPGVSVADAQVQEAEGAALAFQVTLAAAQSSAVSVRYATSDGTATAGTDYVSVSGALRFAPGETVKTVSVPVLNDAHDEGSETLTLTLSSPFGAQIADGTATGTIVNTDPIPKAWIARFGRTVAEQVIDAVEARMRAPRSPGVELSLAGQRVGGSVSPDGTVQTDDVVQAGAGRNLAEWFGNGNDPERRHGPGSQTMTQRDLLLGSSFSFTGGTPRTGTYALWGRGAVTRFDGREDGLAVDGEVTSGMLGADWSRDALMAGLVVSHSLGEGGYRGESGNGGIASSLTGLYPWGRYALSERVSVWGLAGYGEGTLTVTPEGEAPIRTDLDLTMAAAGLRGVLVQAPEAGGFELAVKTDAMGVRTSTAKAQGLEAEQAEVTRLRLGLEGSRSFRFEDGASLTPSVEIGARHDGGDAETGFGVEIGGGLAWSDPERGLSAEVRGRGLLSHAAGGFRERGFSGSLSWDPTPETGRGLKLSMSQTVGAQASGGRGRAHRLREPRSLRIHRGPDGRLEGAGGDPPRGRRHAVGHARAGARLLRAATVMAGATQPTLRRVLGRLLAAVGIWAALGASAAGGEWRSWCGQGSGSGPGQAPDYRPTLGWHFYCDREAERQEVEPPPAQPEPPATVDGQSATDRILELRRALEEVRAEAILDPTPAKVTAYLRLQQETLQRAAVFSDAFRRTVWATPELDYTLKRPVGALAKRVYRLHRAGLAWGTSGSQALCGRYPMPVMRKSQYRWQMTEPVPATIPRTGCNPIRKRKPAPSAMRARQRHELLQETPRTPPPCRAMPARMSRSGTSTRMRWRTKAGAGWPIPTIPADRRDAA